MIYYLAIGDVVMRLRSLCNIISRMRSGDRRDLGTLFPRFGRYEHVEELSMTSGARANRYVSVRVTHLPKGDISRDV